MVTVSPRQKAPVVYSCQPTLHHDSYASFVALLDSALSQRGSTPAAVALFVSRKGGVIAPRAYQAAVAQPYDADCESFPIDYRHSLPDISLRSTVRPRILTDCVRQSSDRPPIMATQKSLDSPDHYTIGWIAALPIERAAATALLDERHDEPHGFSQHPNDTNSYTWGRMGKHNIVIASLAAGVYGTVSAATTASSLLSSLPEIRIGLLVGIGGGIARPDEAVDIRLGDVVVGQPGGATGGVVQYDLAKARPNNKRERRDFLNMPPRVLLHALANLQAEHEVAGSRLPHLLTEMWKANPPMVKSTKLAPGFVHQGFENDRLFKASYKHTGGGNCRDCDSNEEVQRDARDSADPEIHYGIIASGNTLVKDAATRDKIMKHIGEECLCVEMEAAGLMNHFPCLVIRGICDYADSHKNDRWQRYASATAAAFVKELLAYVPARDLQATQRATELFQSG